MGIKGLLAELNVAAKPAHLSQFRGQRVAVDGFSWLHRAAFAALEAVVFEESKGLERCADFFVRRAILLKAHGLLPLFVFDGRGLPAKKRTTEARRARREEARARAEALKAQGNTMAARKLLGQAISVKFSLVLATLKALRRRGFEFLVAPYEADAQLGYLCQQGFVDAVISEDSDLVLYGCHRILFKLDDAGACQLCEFDPRESCQGLLPGDIACEDALIVLCAMAGCDYVEGVKGIGLKKGAKFVARAFRNAEAEETLSDGEARSPAGSRLRKVVSEVKLAGFEVESTYDLELRRALWTFKHQPVFDPTMRKVTRRYPLPSKTSLDDDLYKEIVDRLGPLLEEETMIKICDGLLEPNSLEPTRLDEVAPRPAEKENVQPVTSTLDGWRIQAEGKPMSEEPYKRKRRIGSGASCRRKIVRLDEAEKPVPASVWNRQDTTVSSVSTGLSPSPPSSVSGSAPTSSAVEALETFKYGGASDLLQKPRAALGLPRRQLSFARMASVIDTYRHTRTD